MKEWGEVLKNFKIVTDQKQKYLPYFLERDLDISFYVCNEATVSTGMINVKLQIVATGYLLNITQFA